MGIIVDDRQSRSSPRIHETLLKNLGVANVAVERLEFADYAFVGKPISGVIPTVGIEHATLSDFLGKIKSERLSFQLVGMLKAYNVPILMVQGLVQQDMVKDPATGRMAPTGKLRTYGFDSAQSYAGVMGVIYSAQLHGIKFVNTSTVDESAEEIVRMYRYMQADPDSHKMFREQPVELGAVSGGLHIPVGGGIDRPVRALMALSRDIGETRALAALEHAGNLIVILKMDKKQLQEIPGWGPKLAGDFYDSVHKWYGDTVAAK